MCQILKLTLKLSIGSQRNEGHHTIAKIFERSSAAVRSERKGPRLPVALVAVSLPPIRRAMQSDLLTYFT